MSRPPLKTVRIKSPYFAEGVLINARDFEPARDVLFTAPAPDNDADKSKGR